MNKSFNLMQGKTGNYPGQEGGSSVQEDDG